MRPLTDGERETLAEQERDARDLADVADLDDGGFDRDEWCPPELWEDVPVSEPVVIVSPPAVSDPEFPW